MPNKKGWYTREEMEATQLPFWMRSGRWSATPYDFAVLLSKSRCKEFGIPILPNGMEKPSAFAWMNANQDPKERIYYNYAPLYDRTSVFQSGELSMDKLHPREIMRDSATGTTELPSP